MNLTYDLTSRLSSTTGVYYHHDENQGSAPEQAQLGRRILSILLSVSIIRSISVLPCMLDYNHTYAGFARSEYRVTRGIAISPD